jgi:hypothetical protein
LNPRPLRAERGHAVMATVVQCQAVLLTAQDMAGSVSPRQAVVEGSLPFCCLAGPPSVRACRRLAPGAEREAQSRLLRGAASPSGLTSLPTRPWRVTLPPCVPGIGRRLVRLRRKIGRSAVRPRPRPPLRPALSQVSAHGSPRSRTRSADDLLTLTAEHDQLGRRIAAGLGRPRCARGAAPAAPSNPSRSAPCRTRVAREDHDGPSSPGRCLPVRSSPSAAGRS